jgi:hypothetical protein
MITKPDFEAVLGVEVYVEIETKMLPPRPANDDHGHRYAVKGLVLEPVLLWGSSTGLCDRSRAKVGILSGDAVAPRPDSVGGMASVTNFGGPDVCKWDIANFVLTNREPSPAFFERHLWHK